MANVIFFTTIDVRKLCFYFKVILVHIWYVGLERFIPYAFENLDSYLAIFVLFVQFFSILRSFSCNQFTSNFVHFGLILVHICLLFVHLRIFLAIFGPFFYILVYFLSNFSQFLLVHFRTFFAYFLIITAFVNN